MKIRIGTRKSRLAMIQTEIVKNELQKATNGRAEIEIVPIVTQGDKILNRSLTSFGGKGVFTKELEEQLLSGAIDLAVHSAKDLPMELPDGLAIGAVLRRGDPRDVLVTVNGIPAHSMKPDSVIGTSSLRRELQIKKINPHVQIKLLRGNVETRLEKLKSGAYDGIILAAAGLERLGLLEREGFFFEYLDPDTFVPAAGQGILAVEARKGELTEVLSAIHSQEAAEALTAERTFLTILGGGCNAPCGAHCYERKGTLFMNVMYAADGKHPRYDLMECQGEEKDRLKAAKGLAEELSRRVSRGKAVLAGAGPGDEGLLSLKALEAVKTGDVIVYDSLIPPSVLNEARLDAELIYVGKRSGSHSMKQEEINRVLIEKAREGKTVVRLKGGDPFVFGRGGEEAKELSAQGIPFEVIPGVSSSYSVPAYAGIPVTERNIASSFHVITGHEGAHKKESVLDYEVLAKEEGTLVFLMGLNSLSGIVSGLLENGKPEDTSAAVIERGTTAVQKMAAGTLLTIEDEVKKQGIKTPAIIVIGETVRLRESLQWFENGSLFGTRILITGTRQMVKQMKEALKPLKAELASVSLIETESAVTEEIKEKISHPENYTWIVFTSSNGVNGFFAELLKMKIDLRSLMHVKFAVIGRGTEKTLREHGFFSDFVPSVYSSEGLAKEWTPLLTENDRILLVRARESSRVLPAKLAAAKISYDEAPIYQTVVDWRRKEELNRLLPEMDYVVLTSGSGARAFAAMVEQPAELAEKKTELAAELPAAELACQTEMCRAKLAAIGPVTAEEAEKAGLTVDLTADTYTAEGIAEAILNDIKDEAVKGHE